MATQRNVSSVLEISSFIRGYHAYMDVWEPRIGEVLMLQREINNPADQLAVAVVKSGVTVGHVPYNLAPVLSHFLNRATNTGVAEITGDKVNRGGGYGLEIPCLYRLSGRTAYIERAKKLLEVQTQETNRLTQETT